jgi:uncharacterized coiled-coil protein SlyX
MDGLFLIIHLKNKEYSMKKVIVLLFVSVTIFCAQTFVVQKQDPVKKESRSRLKERVCQLLYDVLDGSTSVLSSLSQVQKTTLGWLSDFVTADKKNSIDTATDVQLKALIEQLDAMVKQYAALQDSASSLVACISKNE